MRAPYEVRLHPAAADDLARLAEAIAARAGWAAATRTLDAIAAALRALALTPHKGTIRDEIAPGLRAIPTAGRGVIAFVVDDAGRRVLVKAIGYAGSDWAAAVGRR